MELQSRFARTRDARKSAIIRQEWIQTQRKTFTNWMNAKLSETGYNVKSLETDLIDGVALIKLMEVLSHGKKVGRYRQNPSLEIHRRENLEIVFRFMTEVEKIPLVNIGAEDIHNGNLKLILGMLWSFILRYQISDGDKKRDSAKKSLLGWVNACLPENNITNFSSDWNDGCNLSALVNYCKPGLISDHASLDPYTRLKNVTNAMDIASMELGVPSVMYPEDLAANNPDELSVMTYISGFCCPNSPGQTRLLEWINRQIPNCPATNFTTDWCDGMRLGALVDSVSGNQFPDTAYMSRDDSFKNCRESMEAATYFLGIEKTITPEDFAAENLNQLTRMTYLAHFQHAMPKIEVEDDRFVNCTVSNLPTGKLEASKTHSFVVDISEAGPGELSASIRTDYGVKKCMIREAQNEGEYSIIFTPNDIGPVHVEVLYDGSPIPGSPFEFTVNSPKQVTVDHKAIEDRSYEEDEPISFRVSTQNAGDGTLTATVLDPEGIERNADITDLGHNTSMVYFTPYKSGHHSIIITFDGVEISDVPAQIFVKEKCKAQNVLVTKPTEERFRIEQMYEFHVNAANAGNGMLTVSSHGTKTGFAPTLNITEEGKGQFAVCFVTTKTDVYLMNIQWGEEEVPGSPFSLLIEDKSRPERVVCNGPHFKIGSTNPITLNVNAENAGSGGIETACIGTDVGIVATEIIEDALEPRKYNISFTPPKLDVYAIEVRLNGKPVPNSPFIANILRQCNNVTVVSKDSEIFEKILPFGQPASFRISTSEAGAGTLNITSRGPAIAEITTVGNKDSTCTCSFVPSNPGRYFLDVLWNDEHIKGSPFILTFASKESVVIPGLDFENETFKVGIPHRFKLHCADLGEGNLTIQSIPESCAQVRITQVPNSLSYACEILPQEVGTHKLVVRYGGILVLGSPFSVTFERRGDGSKCRMVDEPVENLKEIEDSVSFCISTEGAGKGKLTASAENTATKESVPVSITQTSDDRYNVKFSPANGAEYLLAVKYDSQHILGSPFNLVFDQLNGNNAATVQENPENESNTTTSPEYETIGPPKTIEPTCKAYGDGLSSCVAGKGTTFIVDTPNEESSKLTVTITADGEVLEPTIFSLSNTQKEIQYTPTKKGKYTISILWDGKDIQDSPFTVDCYPPLGSLFGSEQSLSRIFLGYL